MPPVEENRSRILEDAFQLRESLQSSHDVADSESKLSSLHKPEQTPRVQSLKELWGVIKDVVRETQKSHTPAGSDVVSAPHAVRK